MVVILFRVITLIALRETGQNKINTTIKKGTIKNITSNPIRYIHKIKRSVDL